MLEHSIYSVISPEGCASILWRSAANAGDAAAALRLTAQDLLQLGIIDRVISEPLGGAHRAPDEMIAKVGEAIGAALAELSALDQKALIAARHEKFLGMGQKGLS
jgi:acetyl-CoA carboxylase carboxyl transferase subunit alpha